MELRREPYVRSKPDQINLTAKHDRTEGLASVVRFHFTKFGGGVNRSNDFAVDVDWDDLVHAIECFAEDGHVEARLVKDLLEAIHNWRQRSWSER